MPSLYKAGAPVPGDGVYRALHDRHEAPHEGVLLAGDEFPYCRMCKGRVRFRAIPASSLAGTRPLSEHPCFRYRPKPATAQSLFRAAFGRGMRGDEKKLIVDAPSNPEPLWNKKAKAKGAH